MKHAAPFINDDSWGKMLSISSSFLFPAQSQQDESYL